MKLPTYLLQLESFKTYQLFSNHNNQNARVIKAQHYVLMRWFILIFVHLAVYVRAVSLSRRLLLPHEVTCIGPLFVRKCKTLNARWRRKEEILRDWQFRKCILCTLKVKEQAISTAPWRIIMIPIQGVI